MSNLEKTNKLYGTNNGGEPVVPVVDGLTQMSSKMSTLNSTDPGFLVDAFNIDWSSGKYYFNDEQIFSTGQLIEEINKKATTSDWGGNIEDLRSSTYISVQINIYKAFNEKQTNLSAPTFASGVDADNPSSNPPTDWYVSIDTMSEGQYVYMSSCYKVVDLNNTLKGYCGPCSTPIFLPSENGLNGNFKSTVFTRTNTTPAAPANGANYGTGLPTDTRVYDASNNQQISGKSWSDGIPEGKEIVWASSAIISDDNGNIDTSAAWSIPRQMTDTSTYDVEFSFSESRPEEPTDSNRHNGSGTQIWFDPTLDALANGETFDGTHNWSDMIWRAERECINGVWSNWTISRIKGERGVGVSGPFVSTVFTRTNKDISSLNISETVTAGQYNEYAHPIPPSQQYDGETIVWTDGTPEGPGALWSAWKTFSLTTDNGEWSSPHLMADTDTYDVEFSPSETKPDDPSTDPSVWIDPTTNHYKDHTEQVPHIYNGSWEDMIWRAERTKNPGDEWANQPWVITQIKGEDGEVQKPVDYYQSRYAKINKTSLDTNDKLTNQTGNGPSAEHIDTSENVRWYKYVPSSGTGNVWQTMRRVTWQKDNNTWVELYDPNSSWEEPFMLNGLPGEAQPIHPCLLYKWDLDPKGSNDNPYTPQVNQTAGIPSGWTESPNNPTQADITAGRIFLWMIQGEYKIDGNSRVYQKINGDNYWTTPICLSGADGKPGEDGDDIEFIYKSFTNATSFDGTTDDSPQHWYTTNIEVDYEGTGSNAKAKPDYLGPTGKEWSDNASAQVISPSNRYVYCSYRRSVKSGNTRYWTPFSPPFPWSIWGENGIDGDGVEYIYWICNEYPVQSGHEWNTNDFNPNNWDPNATNGKDGKDFQDDDYLGPNNQSNKWTDEPTGVSLSGKYEYVSTRKKIQDPNDPKKKIWDIFSIPSLWSNFAEDGVATNMVLETDNDNVTVGIDGDGLVNNDYSTSSNIYLRYNGISQSAYDLSLDITILLNKINSSSPLYNKLSCTDSNRNLHWNNGTTNGVDLISINNSTKTIAIVIPKNFPIGAINNLMEVQLCATTNAAIGDVQSGEDYTRIFTVSGVELSIEDIYQIGLNTTTPHRNANNDGFDSIQLWLSSFTSTNIINNANDAAAANMFVTYYSTNKNISAPTGSPNSTQLGYLTNFNVTLNPYYNKHIFIAYYNSDVSSINDVNIELVDSTHINNKSTKFLDSEEATAVYDGTNGVDSRSEEYIYLLTDDIDFLTNKNNEGDDYYIPSSWYETGTSVNYQNDDYPFLAGSPTINGIKYITSITINGNNNSHDGTIITNDKVINIWTDNPQGVSEEYPYEFRAQRKYKTTNADGQRWLAFEKPICWANWGHSGEDGDGVEYIYYKNDSNVFDGPNPSNWTSDENFQSSEYINDEVNLSEYYGDYVNKYLTFEALGSGNITLTIPANVDASCVSSVSYKKNRGAWTTKTNSSSAVTITVSVVAGDIVEWKGTATKYSNGITTDNYNNTIQYLSTYASNFDATCNYNIYGNIMSLLHGDNFVNKIELTTEFTFAGLFGTYDTSRTTLKNAENLVLPAIILTNGCYTYMFSCNTGLKTCPKILPYRGIGLTRMYQSMFANCCKTSELATESIAAPLILCKGSTANNCWMYRMFGSAQYINKVELWIDYYYYSSTFSHNRYGFDYFLQNNKTNGTIIQHGSADLSIIYDFRDIPNNTQNEQDVVPSITTPTYYSYNWTITKNAGTLVWTDNPSGVSETDKYEWVSVRKYKEVTEDDTELLTNFDVGQKAWHPYSEPKLWAKYGENGDPGQPGSSGLTFEFDNPSIQVAVNSNGLIKDNQNLLSYLHVYAGEREITEYISSVSFDNSSIYQPFNYDLPITHTESGETVLDFFSKIFHNSNNNTWLYSCYIGDLDVNNNGIDDYNELNNPDHFPAGINMSLNNQLSIPVTITYNTIPYNTHLTFTPIYYGVDGQDAELFELSSETSVIRSNTKSDNLDYEPSYVEYNIHHVRGNNDETQYINEIVSYTDINEYLSNGTLKLYYHLDTVGGVQQHEGGTIVVGDQTRPVPGMNSTTLFADTNTSLSGSGLYTTEGASLGGTKTDTTSTSHFVTDVNTIQADSVVVVPVREVELERNTAEETLLTYLDNSLNWSSMFNSYVGTNSQNTSSGSGSGSSGGLGGLTPIINPTDKYDKTNIASVAQALNDYADYLETLSTESTALKSNYSIEDVRNTADIVSNVASSLGEITTAKDGSQSWALSNEASIYVNDVVAQQDAETNTSIHTKVSAIEIQQKRDDLIQAQTIRDDLVQQGTYSEYYDNYASPEYTRIASATIDETWKLLTMSNNDEDITFKLDINNLIKNRQNWTPSSNGTVVNPSIINENISGTVTLIRIRLVYDNSETLTVWDEDSLEIVYDGVDGVDSDVLEYIYYCPAYTSQKTWDGTGGDNSENPANWTASTSADYFPDGNVYIDNGSNGGWADHPHGVDSEHPYEYYSIRTKDGETGQWSLYETPVVWSHYGETGRDGDGVEYIYWRPTGTTIKTWDPEAISADPELTDPRSWDTASNVTGKNGRKFQDNEYLGPTHSPWTDNPTGVTAENSYEYVSQRKYNGSTKLWEQFSMPAVWTNYGQKGDTGDPGAAAYVLDFTNEQLNFAVDEDGNVIKTNAQYKLSYINFINCEFDNSDPNKFTLSNPTGWTPYIYHGRNNYYNSKIYWADGNGYNEWMTSYNHLISLYTNYYEDDNAVRIAAGTTTNVNINIPEEGIDVSIKIPITLNNGNKTTIDKVIRIYGQHTAQDGENAVTYEIVPNVNSLKWDGTQYTTSQLSYTVYKYDGLNTPTVFNDFSSTTYGWWRYLSGNGTSGNTGAKNPFTISGSGYKNMQMFYLDFVYDNKIIDTETIPVVSNGEQGAQGFGGPVVRNCGEYSHSRKYGNGNYNKSNNEPQYDGTSILYKDIVSYTNTKGTRFYTPSASTTYITEANNTYLCKGSAYIVGTYPAKQSSNTLNAGWIVATQFDFIATKLLYADQALINQISSHDFIATTQDGTPVAGMTSGKKDYGNNNSSLSLLNNANHGNVDTGGVTGSSSDTLTDTSHVRIFAGQIWDNDNSYSLTYAPFNVRQDGTTYMSKANIVGNVNIGGNVDISGNVNIHGNNVRIDGDLYANTLALSTNSFYYNEYRILPDFNENEIKMHQLMFYGAPNTTSYLIPQPDTYLLMINSNGLISTDSGGDTTYVSDKALYTLYSKYGDISSINSNVTGAQKFWLVTKTDLFEKPNNDAPATISYPISINITNVSVNVNTGIVTVEFSKGGTPSVKRYGWGYNSLHSWSYHLQFKDKHYWRQKIKGIYMSPGDSNPDDLGITPDGIIIGTVLSDYEYAEYNGSVPAGISNVTKNMAACAAKQVSGDTQGGVMRWYTHHGSVYSWAEVTSIDTSLLSCTGTCILARTIRAD